MDDLSYWLALHKAPGIGSLSFNQLVEQFTDIKQLFDSPGVVNQSQLSAARKKSLIHYLQSPDWQSVENELHWAEAAENHILHFNHPDYPELLKQIHSPPAILFVKGQTDVLNEIQLAIVGSRNPSVDGSESAYQFARHLAGNGMVISSGMALGIDAQSHLGALSCQGRSVAVAGTGLDRIYPARHKELAWKLLEKGAIISEYSLGVGPAKQNFPQRNRIISGLSVGTLVVEAALKSGSLITAKYALEQAREVFAIPGSIHNPLSRGCHQLIKSGAKLVETAEDILEELSSLMLASRFSLDNDFKPAVSQIESEQKIDPLLPKIQQLILKNIAYSPVSVEVLIERCKLNAADISANLILLEVNDYLQTHPGGMVSRKP
ncbi:MAG: DNA-processing protein DprA [gamma proteobacterium symbiont of Taylorina sp.]|nr:DNA-processing protein DprA [gamma proteobacterium symbiont of Taylorina sp.]